MTVVSNLNEPPFADELESLVVYPSLRMMNSIGSSSLWRFEELRAQTLDQLVGVIEHISPVV
jgi:hypothetical protein